MELNTLKKISFAVCILCIVFGVIFGLSLIWISHDSEFIWRCFITVGLIFFGSASTLSVSAMYEGRTRGRSRNDEP